MLRNTGVVIGLGFFLWMIQMEMLPQARKMMDLYSINMLSPTKIKKKRLLINWRKHTMITLFVEAITES